MSERIAEWFPALRPGEWRDSSPMDPAYNCFAWAAGDASIYWDPFPRGRGWWPVGVPRERTLPAYLAA